ncbi:metallophosphoesterase family protein [Phreatobacter stygius]|uniref:Metallophosphoesterase-domain-containing protein n=1 Tax=Phreatobacter stygius TaxID=1940610 RepID=A0A4D7B6L8_9HYPH|nr:metallophosphoesterase [Phreatobacter stygius]QCI65870.1 metallophosphoesterase-domain-containing protein [Phreatobacter stygius]
MSRAVRLCLVTDIHHGKPSFTKAGPAALGLMAEFRRFVAETRPDAVLDLGDRISDEARDSDLVLEQEVAEAFAPIAVPRFHIDGNHDRDYLTVGDNDRILGRSAHHETLDLGDWRLAIWRADAKLHRPGGFALVEADLLWLADVVRSADRPLVIVSHVPVSGHSQVGNYWFENNPHYATYPSADRIRAVLRQARVPVICISGHVHWNTLTTVDGIAHITLQSLTETFTTQGEAAGAFALLELSDTVLWQVHGRDPFTWSTDRADLARRWMTPLPDFRELAGAKMRLAAE